jgi:hypothetical protein
LVRGGNISPDSEFEDLHAHQAFQFMALSSQSPPMFNDTYIHRDWDTASAGLSPLARFQPPGNILGLPLSAPFSFIQMNFWQAQSTLAKIQPALHRDGHSTARS